MTISVVVPTWNEEVELPETLRRLRAVPEVKEIIVSDAGSIDQTVQLAREAHARIVVGSRSRGGQLRRGAEVATGEVVWFVHADTWVPLPAGRAILEALRDPSVVGGACFKEFRDPPWLTQGSAWRCDFRMRWFQFAYGDQGIFVRRPILQQIGGVADVPLMEEFQLCSDLRLRGKLALAQTTLTTSARRFRQRGLWRTYLRMGWINLRYHFGARPTDLLRHYERE